MFSTQHKRRLFLALSLLFVLLLLLNTQSWPASQLDALRCFQAPSNASGLHLEDVLLASPQPPPGRSIFFLETSCSQSKPDLQLTARQACAIESAALHNPNLQVYVLFASPRQLRGSGEPLLEAIRSYSNVQLRQLNLQRYAAGTPIETWLQKGQLLESQYLIIHISDLLRLLTLYHFGGIYLDTDVVLLRSLEQLPLNYAGAESDTHIANGVMSLSPTGLGHEFAASCLRDFQHNFDGSAWGNNGPGVITRVAQSICGTKHIASMLKDEKRCRGFRVFPRETFYAVRWMDWRHFFEPQFMEQTLALTKDSYLIHVWNKHSHQQPIKVGSSTAYGKIASQHCPKSYAAAGEFF